MKLDQTEQVSLWIPKQKKRQNKTQNLHSCLFMKAIKKQFQLLSKCVMRFPEKTGFTFVNQRRRLISFTSQCKVGKGPNYFCGCKCRKKKVFLLKVLSSRDSQ